MHLDVNDVLPCDSNANARDEAYSTVKENGIDTDGKLPDSNPSITEECEHIIRNNEDFPNPFGSHYQMLLRILSIPNRGTNSICSCQCYGKMTIYSSRLWA